MVVGDRHPVGGTDMRYILTGVCAAALSFAGASFAQDKSTAAKSSTETEQATTKTMNGKTVKTNAEVVSGKVESYEAGKSLSVTVPGKIIKTKSFDLNSKNETVHMSPSIKKGDWVTVREMKDNNGHKTVTVSRSKHAMKTTS
jgi:hypothetical protein